MGVATLVFLAIGGFSLLLLVLSLIGGAHVHLGHFHFGHLRLRAVRGDELSLPQLCGFLGAFGFGSAVAAQLLPVRGGLVTWAATGVGLLVGVPFGWAAGRLVRAADGMSTDHTPTSGDLVGTTGLVISEVPDDGYGQVRIRLAGQQMKFNARADRPLALGTPILVIGVLTPTSVLVEPLPEFLVQKEGQ